MSRAFVKDSDRDPEPHIVHTREHRYLVTPLGFARMQRDLALAQEHGETRIAAELQSRIAVAEVIDPAQQKTKSTVDFGARVTVEVAGQGRQTYAIVGEDEADPVSGSVSWLSPLAQALWGKRSGSRAVWPRPAGNVNVRLISVEY